MTTRGRLILGALSLATLIAIPCDAPPALGQDRTGSAASPIGVVRAVPQKPERTVIQPWHEPRTIIVKFREGSGVRLRTTGMVAAPAEPMTPFLSVLARAGIRLAQLRPLFDRSEVTLDAQRAEAMRRSGREVADLNLYYQLRLPAAVDSASLVDALNALSIVELAEPAPRPAPPPVDLPPPTPSFVASQGYRAAAPQGVGALDPATIPGGPPEVRAAGGPP